MDELISKIHIVKRKRYEYFLQNPGASQSEYERELKENSTRLLEEIPINIGQAWHHYFVGRILNICVDYDPNAEESLNMALRLDSTNVDAWLELGNCVWKKPDPEKAYACFREASERKRSARVLSHLSAAIRARLSKVGELKERLLLVKECVDICKEAVEKEPGYAFAWLCLGNTYMCRFFMVNQLGSKDLTYAADAFAKALTAQADEPFVNADLHLNYATALWYAQKYADALNALRRALEIEPHFTTARNRLESLEAFLDAFNESISKRGKLAPRKFKDMTTSISPKDWGTYGSPISVDGKSVTCAKKMLQDLRVGDNTGSVVCVKVVGVVPNADEIPYTMVGADSGGSVIGITMFNCSKDFGVIIGDSLAIPDPLVVEVKNLIVRSKPVSFRTIRVDNPVRALKNGKPLRNSHHAFAAVSFQQKAT